MTAATHAQSCRSARLAKPRWSSFGVDVLARPWPVAIRHGRPWSLPYLSPLVRVLGVLVGSAVRQQVAVIGGSVAGLAAAMALARRAWKATVVERDPPPPTDDGDEAFLVWERRSVPQFRQPHGFSARSRNLLLAYIPEVVERLVTDGIEEVNFFRLLAPPDLWSDEDEAYTSLFSRRPAFELAIRRTAEGEPGVHILSPAAVAGIRSEPDPGGVPRVTGLRPAMGR